MDASLREVFDLVVRWIHLIAGIMWVGNSMLFNWLDRNLEKPEGAKKGLFGEIWMLHSGGYYQVEKKMIEPGQMPKTLHWFKWQSYSTWISGITLLILVYYMQDGFLVDDGARLTTEQAKDFGLAFVFGGFAIYDLLWRTIGRKSEQIAHALTLAMFVGAPFLACHFLAGRAAYIHVGALIGTCMAGNVFLVIVPSQRELVKKTESGNTHDLSLSDRAKQRSIHNNYFTFPLLFLMVSNHFPLTYTNKYPALMLIFLATIGALVRHILNIRFTFQAWIPALASVLTIGIVGLVMAVRISNASTVPTEKVPFARAEAIIQQRCLPCHAAHPTDDIFTVAPKGVMFDSKEQIKTLASEIKMRAVTSKQMPQGNKTHITDEERATLGAWVAGGAPLD